jgi:outer membrane protein assembly factor BamD
MTQMLPRLLGCLALILSLAACGGKADTDLGGANLAPPDTLYRQGVTELGQHEYDKSKKTFDSVEENYPYSSWATHAQLLSAYAQYKNQDYDDAISALNRYIALHPTNQDAAYAYYLKALCYYEQIDDVQRDQTATFESIQTLNDVITRFPDTD